MNEVRAVASKALGKVRSGLDEPKLSARDAAVVFGILSEKAAQGKSLPDDGSILVTGAAGQLGRSGEP